MLYTIQYLIVRAHTSISPVFLLCFYDTMHYNIKYWVWICWSGQYSTLAATFWMLPVFMQGPFSFKAHVYFRTKIM